MKTLLLTLCVLTLPNLAHAQTCEFPWTSDHDDSAQFEVGSFYRNPYADVIEILAETCIGYDTLIGDDGTPTPVCVPGLAVRIVQGRPFVTSPRKSVLYLVGRDTLAYTSLVFPADRQVGVWGKLPAGCYPLSTVVSVRNGTLQVRVP